MRPCPSDAAGWVCLLLPLGQGLSPQNCEDPCVCESVCECVCVSVCGGGISLCVCVCLHKLGVFMAYLTSQDGKDNSTNLCV